MKQGIPYKDQYSDKADLAKLAEREEIERSRAAPRPPGLHHTPPATSTEARAMLDEMVEHVDNELGKLAAEAAPGVLARFDETLKSLNRDRGADYGHPYHNFEVMAAFTEALEKCPDRRLRQALIMIAAKVSRLVQNPYHLDSWVDIAGYARTAVMVMDYDDTTSGGNTM